MKKKIVLLTTFATALVVISMFFLLNQNRVQSQKVDNLADEQFSIQMGLDVLMDQSLSIEVFSINRDLGNLYPKELTFMVANLSNEAIVFPDTYYGVIVYEWDTPTNHWVTVSMKYTPFQLQTILQPGDKSKIAPRNSFSLFGDDFIDQDLSVVRIYISGKGATSGNQYGDYIDVNLKNP